MPSSSFAESWLGFVTVLVRRRLLEDVLVLQVLEQIEPQFHRPCTQRAPPAVQEEAQSALFPIF
jgi:hypothetical protein